MFRFVLALILIIFSFNVANASELMTCCDIKTSNKTSVKTSSAMPKCHEMAGSTDHKLPEKPQDLKKASHWLCASMCANKMVNAINIPEFKAASFDLPAFYGEHDIGLSIDRRPSTPPPKI